MELNDHHETPNATTTILSNDIELNKEELVTVLYNTYEIQQDQEKKTTSIRTSSVDLDVAIHECPMCLWTFPPYLTLENKEEHIEKHFLLTKY